MGLFGKRAQKGPRGNVLPDWSTDPITPQHSLAETPPDLLPLARGIIERAGRGSLLTALTRLYTMVGFQADAFTSTQHDLRKYDFEAIRETLMARPDFDESMLFSSLTYFGPGGVAANNALIEQLPLFVEALEQAARDGHLDD